MVNYKSQELNRFHDISRKYTPAQYFPKHFFWDVDVRTLSYENDKGLIIPRALYFTSPETFEMDIQALEQLYSRTEIYRVLVSTSERISNDIYKLISRRYHKPIFKKFGFIE